MKTPRFLLDAIVHRTMEFTIHQSMVSAQPDSDIRFSMQIVDNTIWLYPSEIMPNASEYIYARKVNDHASQGFAGRIIPFSMSDGSTYDLKGPWNTGPDGLYRATGVDYRSTTLTRGIVACYRSLGRNYAPDLYVDVLHYDEAPVIGLYNRVDVIADALVQEFRRDLVIARISRGGGFAGNVTYKKEILQ